MIPGSVLVDLMMFFFACFILVWLRVRSRPKPVIETVTPVSRRILKPINAPLQSGQSRVCEVVHYCIG